jgi:hypothetical protein
MPQILHQEWSYSGNGGCTKSFTILLQCITYPFGKLEPYLHLFMGIFAHAAPPNIAVNIDSRNHMKVMLAAKNNNPKRMYSMALFIAFPPMTFHLRGPPNHLSDR